MPHLSYFITFRTYGSWLHGHVEGSVDREHATPGTPLLAPDPARERREFQSLRHSPVELDAERRFVIDATIVEVCAYRRWTLHARHVRTNHVHVVVAASHSPERVMNDLKAYSTRRMREAVVLDKSIDPWAYHGSTRYLNTEVALARAIDYVLREQGEPLEMRCPDGWKLPRRDSPSNHERQRTNPS